MRAADVGSSQSVARIRALAHHCRPPLPRAYAPGLYAIAVYDGYDHPMSFVGLYAVAVYDGYDLRCSSPGLYAVAVYDGQPRNCSIDPSTSRPCTTAKPSQHDSKSPVLQFFP